MIGREYRRRLKYAFDRNNIEIPFPHRTVYWREAVSPIDINIKEGMIGHMGTQKIRSLEAGVVLVDDGCDMEGGRAKIPLSMESGSKIGDIHKY